MSFFKEFAEFYYFFWKTKKSEKEVVFYVEHEDYYPYFEGLVKKLTEECNQSICYVTSSAIDPILKMHTNKMRVFYVNKMLAFFMVFIDCKICVMTLSDLNQFHIKRSMNHVHYVYVFHAMVSTHMMYRSGAFDYYDHILCVGPHHIEEIRKHEKINGLSPKKLVEAGYYRLERIYEAYQKYSSKKSSTVKAGIILIAPSWGSANVLELCGETLVDTLLKANYDVIVRPHPETVRRSPGLMAMFVSRFGNNPFFTLETSVATDDSLLQADVLICDCSGVAFEYAFGTERPVLFMDTPLKIKNQRFKELGIEPLEISLRSKIGKIISPEEIQNVPKIISELMSNRETYKERLSHLRRQHVYAFGCSAVIGARYIIELTNNIGAQNNNERVS